MLPKIAKEKVTSLVQGVEYVDFLYVNELEVFELEKQNNVAFSDNGNRSLFYMRNKDNVILNYTNKLHMKINGRTRYQKKIEKVKNQLGIHIL